MNVEFWQAFGPAMQAAAKEAGIENFFAFGEVYDDAYDPAFQKPVFHQAKLQSTIDFGFQAAARALPPKVWRPMTCVISLQAMIITPMPTVTPTASRRSPAYDMGRIGNFLKQDQPEAADASCWHALVWPTVCCSLPVGSPCCTTAMNRFYR
ncbi:MAG: hypothetical protein R3E95_11545 [Thiolinea sp.]